jgi:hypothetical protein
MLAKLKNFFSPMWRTIWIALAGQGVFIFSVITMSPLRMWEAPVVNYNLYYVPILAAIFGFLFDRCCTVEVDNKAYLYGFFAALFAWPLIGEVANIPVDKGAITQFSNLNIKALGAYFYVVALWIILKILWRTKTLKNSVCVFLLTFLSIWSFELYMDNYSSNLAIETMPVVANGVAIASVLAAIIILRIAKKTSSMEVKTVMGCLLYIALALLIMGSDQWKKPQKFYVKYEAAQIDGKIQELQKEKEHLDYLTRYMLDKSMLDGTDIKYLLDRGLIRKEAMVNVLNRGLISGASIEYLMTKGIIGQELQEAINNNRVPDKDLKYLRDKGLVKGSEVNLSAIKPAEKKPEK